MTATNKKVIGLAIIDGDLARMITIELSGAETYTAYVVATLSGEIIDFMPDAEISALALSLGRNAAANYLEDEARTAAISTVATSDDGRDICYIFNSTADEIRAQFYRIEKTPKGLKYLRQYASRTNDKNVSGYDFFKSCERRLAEHNAMRARRKASGIGAAE